MHAITGPNAVFLLILMLAARQSSKPRQVSYSPLNSVLNLFLAALPAFNLCIVAWWICNKHYFLLMPINLLLSSCKMLLFKPQRAYNPKNWFWPGINLYIAVSKFRKKFFTWFKSRFFVNFQSRQTPLPNITEWKIYQIRSGSSTIRDVIPRFLLREGWSTSCSAKMPDACVVFGCNNTPNRKEGIGLNPIPFYGAEDPQKRASERKWGEMRKEAKCYTQLDNEGRQAPFWAPYSNNKTLQNGVQGTFANRFQMWETLTKWCLAHNCAFLPNPKSLTKWCFTLWRNLLNPYQKALCTLAHGSHARPHSAKVEKHYRRRLRNGHFAASCLQLPIANV